MTYRHGKMTNVIEWLRLNKRRGLLVFEEERQKYLREQYPDVAEQIFFEYEVRGREFEQLFIDESTNEGESNK